MKTFIAALATLLLVGCAAHRTLEGSALPAASMDAELRLVQQEIEIEVPQTNSALFGGGLVGGLIAAAVDNTKAKRAEKAANRVRDELLERDLSKALVKIVQEGVASEQLAADFDLAVMPQPIFADLEDRKLEDANGIVVLTPSYRFNNALDTLKVELAFWMGDRDVVPRANRRPHLKTKTEYSNVYSVRYAAPRRLEKANRDDYAEQWAALGGDELFELITNGMREAVAMLNADIANRGRLPQGKASRLHLATGERIKGWTIRQGDDYHWVRDELGRYIAVANGG